MAYFGREVRVWPIFLWIWIPTNLIPYILIWLGRPDWELPIILFFWGLPFYYLMVEVQNRKVRFGAALILALSLTLPMIPRLIGFREAALFGGLALIAGSICGLLPIQPIP